MHFLVLNKIVTTEICVVFILYRTSKLLSLLVPLSSKVK